MHHASTVPANSSDPVLSEYVYDNEPIKIKRSEVTGELYHENQYGRAFKVGFFLGDDLPKLLTGKFKTRKNKYKQDRNGSLIGEDLTERTIERLATAAFKGKRVTTCKLYLA